MRIEAELAYYPFAEENYKEIVDKVIAIFPEFKIDVKYTTMSTIVYGDQEQVINLVSAIIDRFFAKYRSILEVKFSNACSGDDWKNELVA
jgi:uncharacterized protein YqgV (UPF0045/DUF77 family)